MLLSKGQQGRPIMWFMLRSTCKYILSVTPSSRREVSFSNSWAALLRSTSECLCVENKSGFLVWTPENLPSLKKKKTAVQRMRCWTRTRTDTHTGVGTVKMLQSVTCYSWKNRAEGWVGGAKVMRAYSTFSEAWIWRGAAAAAAAATCAWQTHQWPDGVQRFWAKKWSEENIHSLWLRLIFGGVEESDCATARTQDCTVSDADACTAASYCVYIYIWLYDTTTLWVCVWMTA